MSNLMIHLWLLRVSEIKQLRQSELFERKCKTWKCASSFRVLLWKGGPWMKL